MQTRSKRHRRRRYLVDWRLQIALTAQLLGVLAGVGLLYTLGLFVLPGRNALAELSAEELRSTLLKANAIYFALGGAILGVVGILLTNRIAGPAVVLRGAVEGLCRGEFDRRVRLRDRDHLKPLAKSIEELRDHLVADRDRLQRSLADVEACLREGDYAGARELLARLRGDDEEADAPAAAETAQR